MLRSVPSSRCSRVGSKLNGRSRFCLWNGFVLFTSFLMIGLISQDLVSHVSKITGLDTSQAMVDVYNQKATNNGVSSKMFAMCIDILSSSEIPAELQNVDVVVCAMAYHHIDDTDNTSKVLASLLKKGGHLLVVDLLESCPSSQ